MSLFFGYGLAKLEAPDEIEANNDIIANRARVAAATQFRGNVTTSLPELCFDIFTQDLPIEETFEKEFDELLIRILDRQGKDVVSAAKQATSALSENETLALLEFMPECGKTGLEISRKFQLEDNIEGDYIGDDLSFNWIRCEGLGLNSSKKLSHQIWGRPFVDRDRLKPDSQAASAIAEWRQNRQELYEAYIESLRLENGTLPVGATFLAFRQSLVYADGFQHCYPNSAAGAWFWFTLMTTIGYGNTAPTTEGGRAMICKSFNCFHQWLCVSRLRPLTLSSRKFSLQIRSAFLVFCYLPSF